MDPSTALFPTLLGPCWARLPASVRALHGGRASVLAHGRVAVDGDPRWPARMLRALLRMPSPQSDAAIEVEIHQYAGGEIWRRRFGDALLESRLQRCARWPDAFEERLGMAHLAFALDADAARLRWVTREVRALGVRLPLRWFRGVEAACGGDGDRYRFDVSVRLPVIGLLIAYRGWLEVDDANR